MSTTMPSETITGVTGSVVAAALVIVAWATNTAEIPAAVAAAITTLVSWLAFAVTLVVRARRARARVEAGE